MIETMVYFTQVERAREGSTFIAAGLTIADRLSLFRARLSRLTLAYAMQQTIKEQGELIAHLGETSLRTFSPAQLMALAVAMEQLVSSNQRIPSNAGALKSRRWRHFLPLFLTQTERLSSFAESLRLASDDETQAYLSSLIGSVNESLDYQPDFDWRAFVATLPD